MSLTLACESIRFLQLLFHPPREATNGNKSAHAGYANTDRNENWRTELPDSIGVGGGGGGGELRGNG